MRGYPFAHRPFVTSLRAVGSSPIVELLFVVGIVFLLALSVE
jgi:hypothetical protein